MEQTVYADILFLINFSMDYLCFYITTKLLHRKLHKVRALIASVFGGVYSVAILFSNFVSPLRLVCDIGSFFVMCLFVFVSKKNSFLKFITLSLSYIGVSVALGGIMTAGFNMLNSLGLPLDALSESGDGMPVWLFALLAALSGCATLAGGRFFRKKQSEKSANIEIVFDGKSVRLAALCDTGNLLRDPISGKAVVLAEISAFNKTLPREFIGAVRKKDASLLTSLPENISKSLHLIPSRSAGGSSILYALTPDRISILSDQKSYDIEALFAPVVLESSANGFQALLPPELMV